MSAAAHPAGNAPDAPEARSAPADLPADMADWPVQRPAEPRSAAEARARFYNSGNAFNQKLPDVPARSFDDVAAAALGTGSTGIFPCDQAEDLGCAGPATTPLMLARYARIAPGDMLPLDVAATGLVVYVIRGSAGCGLEGGAAPATGDPAPGAAAGLRGLIDALSNVATATRDGLGVAHDVADATRGTPDRLALPLAHGDVVLLPGGHRYWLHGGPDGALLWIVGNEPQLAFDGSRPGAVPIDVVHYPAAEIERQLDLLTSAGANERTSGHALIFSSERQETSRNLTPSLTLSFNTLQTGATQRMHRHNSAAITLIVQGAGCHSTVSGARCDWEPWSTMVTPPGAPHAHHNDGDVSARFLIVQDGGLHYHARTMGFQFL